MIVAVVCARSSATSTLSAVSTPKPPDAASAVDALEAKGFRVGHTTPSGASLCGASQQGICAMTEGL